MLRAGKISKSCELGSAIHFYGRLRPMSDAVIATGCVSRVIAGGRLCYVNDANHGRLSLKHAKMLVLCPAVSSIAL